jgi:hypothetical protein
MIVSLLLARVCMKSKAENRLDAKGVKWIRISLQIPAPKCILSCNNDH